MKSQTVVDFIAKLTPLPNSGEGSSSKWVFNIDESSNEKGSGAGVFRQTPSGDRFAYAVRFDFPASNDKAEYEALIAGLRMARAMGATCLDIRSDSQLVVNQITEEYQAKDNMMEKYLHKVRELLSRFEEYTIERVPRVENANANALANLAYSYPTKLPRSVQSKF